MCEQCEQGQVAWEDTEMLLPEEGENSCGKIQSSDGVGVARTVGDNKKRF